ncbi:MULTISPECIES: hypothetical protein [Pseudomonas]|uniref:Uncharacterized protein n=1 Tax=Pseudomonas parafulva TaxID=157782 RepID=A0ABM6J6D4_9PSED|nr:MULTISPECIES: hypothetical protein [Pseudomonas]AQW69997.1 hypothetical protein B2J77_18040 [Pseudomonas parafulva]OFS70161.1 hypothetical protein HMPREF3173_21150 [Pseudomonas sp. HMSC08G10]WHU41430.1 hypothetical protein OXL99_21760 [Pseudomonas fulva]
MSFENVEEVVEERDPVSVNKRLAEGWSLLAIVPGFDATNSQAFTCYVLGKVISDTEKTMRMIKERCETREDNEFL